MTSNGDLNISLAAWSLHREFFDDNLDQLGMLPWPRSRYARWALGSDNREKTPR